MKNIKGYIVAAITLLSLSVMAAVTPQPWPVYSTTGTASGATNYHAIISAHSVNNGAPVITYMNATSDNAASVLEFFTASPPILVTGVNTNAIIPCTTNGAAMLVAKDKCVLRHMDTDTYEYVEVLSTTGTTYITCFGGQPATATKLGDMLYKCTSAGTIPVGAQTNLTIEGTGIWSGQMGKPLLIELGPNTAAAGASINAVSAYFTK